MYNFWYRTFKLSVLFLEANIGLCDELRIESNEKYIYMVL
jgi:hypothetical protein